MIHVWTAPRLALANGSPQWRAGCYCGHLVYGQQPAGVIAEMQKHEDAEASMSAPSEAPTGGES